MWASSGVAARGSRGGCVQSTTKTEKFFLEKSPRGGRRLEMELRRLLSRGRRRWGHWFVCRGYASDLLEQMGRWWREERASGLNSGWVRYCLQWWSWVLFVMFCVRKKTQGRKKKGCDDGLLMQDGGEVDWINYLICNWFGFVAMMEFCKWNWTGAKR